VSTDERIAVVAAILGNEWRRQHSSTESMARQIIDALDARAAITKWDEPRLRALVETQCCWIPHADLLAYLNALGGAMLTKGDLVAKMTDLSPRDGGPYEQGDPALQADCLRVYYREKQAGTEFSAIPGLIMDEVVLPARQAARREQAHARQRSLATSRALLVQSGRDFGFVKDFASNPRDFYARSAGQLYRLVRIEHGKWALFYVEAIGVEGAPTEPHIFSGPKDAKDALKARAIKLPRP
jgi:hypothetical protein